MLLTTSTIPEELRDHYLFRSHDVAGTLESIEIALWLIFVLLLFWSISAVFRERKAGQTEEKGPEWTVVVEQEYDKGNYAEALEALATYQLIFPKSALITYWQARCYFQMGEWAKAVEKFEELLRLEPIYRSPVRDYMAFIELNELVPGVEGYLDKT